MRIEELDVGDAGVGGDGEGLVLGVDGPGTGLLEAKRAIVGIGARILFYPTLMYNVVNNKVRQGFHWWDEVDKLLLLGAVPFPGDVPRLKQLGVCGVITLNEPYETLVPTSLYAAHGIEHLVIPTRDYLFAPTFEDICQAVDFIHNNVSSGRMTYVHCKAGRGRSTTIVICYLVQHKQMSPIEAYAYVKQSRPRVLLAASQWQAVLRYHHFTVNTIGPGRYVYFENSEITSPMFPSATKFVGFDDTSFIIVSRADLDGYNDVDGASNVHNVPWVDLSLVCRAQLAGLAALAKLSGFWMRCQALKGRALPCMMAEDCRLKDADQFVKLESLLAMK